MPGVSPPALGAAARHRRLGRMTNRQIRRAQEKQDKKADKEKEKRLDARRSKIQQARERRERRREEIRKARAEGKTAPAAASDTPAPAGKGSRKPGRFSGALMIVTVFFIVLQSAVPPEEAGNELLRTVTSAGFYLLFGYFSVLWLMRRATPRPVMMTLISGAFLTFGVEVAKLLQPELTTDPLMLALSIPGLVGGAYLGRLVYTASPA
jgi:hypothetical protein